MPDARNRRKWLRCAAGFPVKLQVLDKENRKVWTGAGSTINIGGGGALLKIQNVEEKSVKKLFEEKHTLLLAFELPNFFFRVKVGANAAWVEQPESQGETSRRFGISFSDLSQKKEDRISDYVERKLANEIANYSLKRSFEKPREKGKF